MKFREIREIKPVEKVREMAAGIKTAISVALVALGVALLAFFAAIGGK